MDFEATLVGFLNAIPDTVTRPNRTTKNTAKRGAELLREANETAETWYAIANAQANDVSRMYDIPWYQAVGIMSAFSIQTAWHNNVADTYKYCAGDIPTYLRKLRVGKADAIVNSDGQYDTVLDVLNGAKVKNFFRNIDGDLHRVTLDTWMCKLFGVEQAKLGNKHGNGTLYEHLESVVQKVAYANGWEPAKLQAYAWVIIRGSAF